MKIFIVTGSLLMALTVLVGAFGAHSLKNSLSILRYEPITVNVAAKPCLFLKTLSLNTLSRIRFLIS